jgi:hypothetical protein
MTRLVSGLLGLALAAGLAGAPAFAQQPAGGDTQPARPPAGGPGMMPGRGMMQGPQAGMMDREHWAAMMSMMHGGMMRGDMMGGQPFQHVEGRLAFLKTELKITSAQEAVWGKFADAVRQVAQTMKASYEQAGQATAATGAAAALDGYERRLTQRLEAVRSIKAAFTPLYAALSDDQKKVADELLIRMAVM